jgi:hypothetical protein
MVGLTCSDNSIKTNDKLNDKSNEKKNDKIKRCYECDIVYGSAHNF